MNPRFHLLLFIVLLANALYAQTYITNVTLADVEKKKWVGNQTVVISNDIISKVLPADQAIIPLNTTVIDGEGKFLLPGLVDGRIEATAVYHIERCKIQKVYFKQ